MQTYVHTIKIISFHIHIYTWHIIGYNWFEKSKLKCSFRSFSTFHSQTHTPPPVTQCRFVPPVILLRMRNIENVFCFHLPIININTDVVTIKIWRKKPFTLIDSHLIPPALFVWSVWNDANFKNFQTAILWRSVPALKHFIIKGQIPHNIYK